MQDTQENNVIAFPGKEQRERIISEKNQKPLPEGFTGAEVVDFKARLEAKKNEQTKPAARVKKTKKIRNDQQAQTLNERVAYFVASFMAPGMYGRKFLPSKADLDLYVVTMISALAVIDGSLETNPISAGRVERIIADFSSVDMDNIYGEIYTQYQNIHGAEV